MADEKVVGKIDEIQGDGNALIIRATGERIVAKPGELIYEGDTVVTSSSSSVLVSVDGSETLAGSGFETTGVVRVGAAEFARFDAGLFDQTANLLPTSSQDSPVEVGSKPTQDIIRVFNQALPDAGITTAGNQGGSPQQNQGNGQTESVNEESQTQSANEESQSDTVAGSNQPAGSETPERNSDENIDLPNDPTAFGDSGDLTPDGSFSDLFDQSRGPSLVERSRAEEIPDAGTITDTGAVGEDNPEQLPGDGFGTNTDNSDNPERIPDAGTATTTENEEEELEVVESADEDTIVPVDAIDDTVQATEDTPVTINVLGNDDQGNGRVTVSLPSNESDNGGTISVNADGTINYEPAADFNGTDTFTYTITSASGQTDTATVTVTVTPVNDAPVNSVPSSQTTTDASTLVFSSSNNNQISVGDADSDLTSTELNVTSGSLTVSGVGGTVISGNGTGTVIISGSQASINSVLSTITFSGTDDTTLTVTSTDATGLIDIDTIPITVVDSEPSISITPPSTGTNSAVPDVADTNVVHEQGIGDAGDASESTSGTFTVNTGGDSLVNLSIQGSGAAIELVNGSPATPIAVTGSNGSLNITSVSTVGGVTTIAYTYTVNTAQTHANGGGNNTLQDDFAIVATDSDADTSNGTLAIQIVDDVPLAVEDKDNTAEDTSVTINVLTNDDQGTDTATLTSAALATGSASAGSVSFLPNGNVTFTPASGFEDDAVINYTITDADGDTSNSTLTITVAADSTPTVTVTPPTEGTAPGTPTGDEVNTVYEQGLNDGGDTSETTSNTFTISTGNDALASLTIGGQAISQGVQTTPITGSFGTLTITNFDGTTISYTYAVNTAQDHASGNGNNTLQDDFAIVVTDADTPTGDTNPATNLSILIVDDIPSALDETSTVTSGFSRTVNVLANDDIGNDRGSNEGITSATLVTPGAGSLDLSNIANGDITYNSSATFTGDAVINYTITDHDGDTATATLTITATSDSEPVITLSPPNTGSNTGAPDASDVNVVHEQGLADVGDTSESVTSSFTIDTGIDNLSSLTIGGNPVNISGGATANITGTYGTLVINSVTTVGSVTTVNYTYSIAAAQNHTSGNGNNTLQEDFAIVATDDDTPTGDVNVATNLSIQIVDSVPVAVADTRTVSEDQTGIAGNVRTGVNASADTIFSDLADANTVTGAAVGNSGTTELTSNVNTGLVGTYGTFTVQSDGSYTYVTNATAQALAAGASETDVFSYTLKDADGDFSTTTVTFTVTGSNDAPVNTVPGTQTIDEDNTLVFSSGNSNQITVGDVDTNLTSTQLSVNSGILNVTLSGSATISAGANGSGTLTVSGTQAEINATIASITYTPNGNFNGSDTLTILSTDGGALTDTDTVSITVNAVNDAPVNTVPGTQTIDEDSTLVFSSGNSNQITVGDVDTNLTSTQLSVNSGILNVTLSGSATISAGANGSGTLTVSGTQAEINATIASITYTPNGDFNGSDTLTVLSTDGGALTDTDTVSITVNAVNDAPVNTVPGTQTIDEDSTLVFSSGNSNQITVGDVDTNLTSTQLSVNSGILNVTLSGSATISAGANGSGTLTVSGTQAEINATIASITYTPNGDFNGSDTLTVLSTDGGALTDTDTVSITVNAVNDAPVNTVPGTQTIDEDNTLVFSSGNSNQIMVGDVDTNLTSTQLSVNSGILNVTLSGSATISAGANGSGTLTVSGTQAEINATIASITYTPNGNFNGSDTLTILSTDGGALTDTDTVSITVNAVNDAPVNTVPGTQTIDEDSTLVFSSGNSNQITVGDVDTNLTSTQLSVNSGILNVTLSGSATISAGANGSGTLTVSGTQAEINATIASITYTPNGDFNGSDTLTVLSTDGGALTDTDTVSITVNAVNDAPVNTVPGTQTIDEDSTLVFSSGNSNQITVGDVDTNLTSTQLSVNSGILNVTLSGSATISAGANGSGTLTVSGTQAEINATIASITYTPNGNFNGSDTLTILSTDGGALTDTDTVSITVNAVNDAPVNTVPGTQTVDEDSTLVFSSGNSNQITVGDVDTNLTSTQLSVNSGILNVTLSGSATISAGANGSGTLTVSGTQAEINATIASITYTPNGDFNGSDTLTVLSTDGGALTDTDTVTITVNPVNDPPVLDLDGDNSTTTGANYVGTFTEDGSAVAIADNDTSITDVDDSNIESATITLTNAQTGDVLTAPGFPQNGISASVVGNVVTLTGSATLAQYQDAIAAIRFENTTDAPNTTDRVINVVVNDGSDNSNTAVSTITVIPVNDAPVNTVPSLVATDINTTFSFTGTGNTVSSSDPDAVSPRELVTVQLTVTNGTITATATGAGGFASVSAGATGTTTFTLSGTEAEIQASMATLQYTPTAAFTGDATLTTLATDGSGLTDTDITTIRVVDTATTPTLTNLEGSIPESTGLLRSTYTSGDILLFGTGSDNPSTASIDASTIEGLVETAVGGSVTAASVTRDVGGIGFGIERNTSTFDTTNTENLDGENSVLTYTGLIYLEANSEYSFSGFVDDNLHIELGGKTVISTNTNFQAGEFGRISGIDAGDMTEATFTPTVSGYYTIEIYGGNVDANGGLLLNLAENSTGTPGTPGIPKELNGQNYNIYAGADDLIQAGGQIGSFVANTSDSNPDGGYFPSVSGVDIVGVTGTAISLALLPLETAASDVITSITLSAIPSNVIIMDGSTVVFNSNAGQANAGQTSYTFTPKSTLNTGGVDLSALTVTGLTTTTTFTVDATASTLTGTNSAAPLTGASFTVGILPAGYLTDGANSIETDIQSTNDSSIQFGSGINDSLTATTSGQVLYGAGGNDVLVGNTGADTLIGGTGADNLNGGAGTDRIVGGRGADILAGGSGIDVFAWASGDETGAPTDTIVDFTQGSGGDVLDFSGLLDGAHPSNFSDFLSLSGTTLTVDVDGSTGGIAYDDLTIELDGLTATTISQLVSDGNIVLGDDRIAFIGSQAPDDFAGTTADEIFFSGGENQAGDESVRGNGGRDTYVLEGQYTGGPAASLVRVRDFNFQTSAGSEQDVIDLSDVLTGATNATVSNFIDINFNNFSNVDVLRVYQNGNAPGDGSTTADISLELQGGFANLDSIFSGLADVSTFANNANTYDSTAEAAILTQLINNGNLIIE